MNIANQASCESLWGGGSVGTATAGVVLAAVDGALGGDADSAAEQPVQPVKAAKIVAASSKRALLRHG
jgi:hypothetical protein